MSTATDLDGVPEDTLALRLAVARIYAGHHNVASAAMAAGVSRQNWSNWERGGPMRHEDAVLAQIARAMKVSEKWLRDGGPLRAVESPDGGLTSSPTQPTDWTDPQVRPTLRLVA